MLSLLFIDIKSVHPAFTFIFTFFESGATKKVAWTQCPFLMTQTGLGVIRSTDQSEYGMAVIEYIATWVPSSPCSNENPNLLAIAKSVLIWYLCFV